MENLTFTLSFKIESSAFQEDAPGEIARILRATARDIESKASDQRPHDPLRGKCKDAEGNAVGEYGLKAEEEKT